MEGRERWPVWQRRFSRQHFCAIQQDFNLDFAVFGFGLVGADFVTYRDIGEGQFRRYE